MVGDGPVPIGVAQGKWVETTQPAGAEIALINGDLATNYAVLMQKGQKSVLQTDFDSGKFKLVADKGAVNWDPSDAQKQAAAVLSPTQTLRRSSSAMFAGRITGSVLRCTTAHQGRICYDGRSQ
ncbi:substrate-binding domain-containing protein [Acidisoma sp. L85]|uniref:substrate-binding domain-containing protein n=1 Tax=Acidisoma sp. L85 TaxID=1641850 RepID=UPI00352B5A40